MKLKNRLLWLEIHTYVACFFLPITLLYVSTGVLYLFDIEGGHSAEYEYAIDLPDGWPTDEASARQLMLPMVERHQHGRLPPDFYLEDEYIGWFGYKQEIFIDPSQATDKAMLRVNKHDLWHQFLLIHKGLAGPIFWFFAILLGTSLVVSLVTGLVLAVTIPRFRNASLFSTFFGLFILGIVFIFGY